MNAIAKSALAQALIHYVVFRPVDISRGLTLPLTPSGPNRWDVTAYVNSLSDKDRKDLFDGKGHEVFKYLTNTPDWVLAWEGAYEMEICTASPGHDIGQVEPPRTRYIATFRPEADQGKYVVPVNPRGPTDFEVTSIIEALSEEERAEVTEGHNETTDSLRDAGNAPRWVRNWDGPFEVDVTEYGPEDTMPQEFIREPKLISVVTRPGTRFIARFIPIGVCAEPDSGEAEIEPIGPDQWDVTGFFSGKTAEEIVWIVGSSEQRRKLANHGAPYWVTRWNAPFAVELDVYSPEEAGKLEQLHQSNRFYDPGKLTQLPFSLSASIPDSEGRYGRGVRDGIEALALALYQAGVDLSTIENAARTAAEGYGNNEDSVSEEIEDMLVVSTAHLNFQELKILEAEDFVENDIPNLILSLRAEHGAVVYVPGEDVIEAKDLLESLEGKISAGFMAAVRRSIEIGAQYIYFDQDVEAHSGWPNHHE